MAKMNVDAAKCGRHKYMERDLVDSNSFPQKYNINLFNPKNYSKNMIYLFICSFIFFFNFLAAEKEFERLKLNYNKMRFSNIF